MLTEAVFLFRTLVITRVGSSNGQYFIWIAALICYGAPGIVVAASALCLPKSYQSMKYCWLSTDPLLYSIVYPIAVMLLINVIIFIIIMYNITYRSQRFRKNVNLRKISQAVKRAFCMLVVLGLPWMLGYIMLLSQDQATKNIFNVLFTIFNSLQGVLIFILYCFRQENVRNLWLKPLTRRYQTNKSRFQTYNFARKFTNDATQDLSATGDIVTRTRRSTDGILSASPQTPKSEDQQEFVGKTNAAFSNPNQGRSTHLNTNPPPLPSKNSPPSNKPFRSGWV
uniref:G-protein coupled receptors family 2 profile 2 domain-containing protein n=1 Tax=Ciona savignyi TaxID=51511 RepID=H2ZFP7_CIOSA